MLGNLWMWNLRKWVNLLRVTLNRILVLLVLLVTCIIRQVMPKCESLLKI